MPLTFFAGLAAVFLLLHQGVGPDAPQQRPALRAVTEAVRVDVAVDLQGPGGDRLTAGDFEVLDNGRRRAVSLIDTEAEPVNIVLLLDTSRSVAGARWRDLVAASEALVASLGRDDRVALVTFTDLIQGRIHWTNEPGAVGAAIAESDTAGRTSLWDAIVGGLAVAVARQGRTLLLALSDGVDNTSFVERSTVEAALRGSEAVLYTVLTGRHPGLEDLAAQSGGQAFRASSGEDLKHRFIEILDRFRSRYLLSFTIDSHDDPGWHALAVRLTRHRGRVRHREGYWRPGGGRDGAGRFEESAR